MAKTIRVTEEVHDQLHEIADRMEMPVRDVVNDYFMSMGEIVGYCPDHGIAFTEDEVKSPMLRDDYVECPEKYRSCRAAERAHQDVTGGSNKIPVDELVTGQTTKEEEEEEEEEEAEASEDGPETESDEGDDE